MAHAQRLVRGERAGMEAEGWGHKGPGWPRLGAHVSESGGVSAAASSRAGEGEPAVLSSGLESKIQL